MKQNLTIFGEIAWMRCFFEEKVNHFNGLIFPCRCLTGCQDPWKVNSKVSLPTCTNVTVIQRGYRRGPLQNKTKWDHEFWDRPYMAEREISGLTRDGMRCKTPCSHTYYKLERTSVTKSKYLKQKRYDYGLSPEWVFGIELVYRKLLQETKSVKIKFIGSDLSSILEKSS